MRKPFALGRVAFLTFNGLVLFFLAAPIILIIISAFNQSPFMEFPPPGFTLRWFNKFFSRTDLMSGLWLSLEVAALVTLISAVIGTACALAIDRGKLPGSRHIASLVMMPLILPAILTGLGLFQILMLTGIGRPLWVMVLGHTVVALPYVVRTTLAVLGQQDRGVEDAAAVLGASPVRILFEVTLPLAKSGIFAGSLFAFLTSFDQFPISLFLAGPGTNTLPIALMNYIDYELDGAIAVASLLSITFALITVLLLERLIGLNKFVRY
jgi:putative spermidine/putrescine transport system permease protein